jgi:serine/threonine protein kinase
MLRENVCVMAISEKKNVESEQLLCVSCKRFFPNDIRVCPDDKTLLVRTGVDPNIGTVLSGLYEIVSVLGRGGTSVVYKARHQLMDRLVAIKMLLWSGDAIHDEKKIRRFQQEARTTSRLNHPNIATLYDFGISPQGQPYLVMEYLEGHSLEELINNQNHLDCERTIKIFCQLCDALEHAHHRGVVHRDMKPSNVIVSTDDDGQDFCKIVDFGIAELLSTSRGETQKLAGTQNVFGSPYYMSPEQCLNKNIDSRCDIYGVGVSLFQTLTGTVPFNGETIVEMIHKHVNEPPPKMRDVVEGLNIPESLEAVVAQCLEKLAINRPQSMSRLKELLQQSMAGGIDREARFIRLSRVVIVDDDQAAVEAIKQSLDKFEDVCVVAVARNGTEALSAVDDLKPEIILMDVEMPEMNGIDATREIKLKLPTAHVVLMAEAENEKDILSALHAGAEGFILKKFDANSLNNLPLALRAVVQGTIWLDPNITSNVLDVYRQSAADLIGRGAQAVRRQDRSDDMSFLMSLAQSFAEARKFEEAESLYRIALALLERTRKQCHPEVFKACLKLADTYFAQGKMSQAEPLYFQAVEIQTQVLGPEHPHIARTLEKIGELHYAQKDYAQSERFYYWALSIREKAQPPDLLKIAADCDRLAELCKQQQKFGQAEQYAHTAEKKRAERQSSKSEKDVPLIQQS